MHKSEQPGKGMPLGNLTSQFFANVYLNELDQFVKHELHAKYYIRYVDDFVILDTSQSRLELQKSRIDAFLQEHLLLELHPEKSQILKDFKIQMPPELIKECVDLIIQNSIIVEPKEKIDIIKDDPDDNILVETAVAGNASFIVSQDKHLLKLGEFRSIKIVTPAEFVSLLP